MKNYRRIVSNWDEKQVQILKDYNIKVGVGIDSFNIYDLDLYKILVPFFIRWEVIDHLANVFSKKDTLSSDYCVFRSWNLFGYPMPDSDMGYLYNTYETKDMCPKCGVGLVQKDDFRVSRVPKYPIWGLGWIFDEFFVRTDLYE